MTAEALRHYSALILNYNHWRDTVACAQSLLAGSIRPRQIIICDNGSENGSLDHLQTWAAQNAAQRGGAHHNYWRLATKEQVDTAPLGAEFTEELLLIDNGKNFGYAGGNNVGLRLLLRTDIPFIWILNNDTIVHTAAAAALLDHMREHSRCGLCGALTRYLESPEIVQCYGGGWYSPIWGLSGLYGEGDRLSLGAPPTNTPQSLGFVNGASVFLRRAFLESVGLMAEDYFLYCEELDWAERARGRWDLSWAPNAEVLHREGLTTGLSHRRGLGHTLRSAARLLRSRFLFTLKFYPWALPTMVLGQAFAILRNIIFRKK